MNQYASYSPIQLEELFSNFLIDSWSYSKATLFSRNEKAFEMQEIYRDTQKKSASSIGGNAYHAALASYFSSLGEYELSLIELEQVAFALIDTVKANEWKIQKTTPSVEDCIIKVTSLASSLLRNFYAEKDIYISEIKEVLGVELRCDEWLTINGVDIPLPCHAYIDLIVRLKDDKIVIIDHKSKAAFTDDKELMFVSGKQAITYIKCYEAKTGLTVDEVWFIENKHSKNKDNSPQLKKLKIVLDENTRKLYEAMLYEPLKRMLEAVSDPDYVYTINDNDNLVDTAELYEFWAKTMLAEIEDFNIPENKKELITHRLRKIRDASLASISPKTITEFKKNASSFIAYDFTNKDMTNNEKIEHVLRSFGAVVRVAHSINGYSSDTYLLEAQAGVKIANIAKYNLDIANALNVSSVRIGKTLMVYEGKSYLPVEISKKRTSDLLFDAKYLNGNKLPIGLDNFGRTIYWDLDNHATPHMLICGATGSGKSVSIISTIEYAKLAGITDIIIFDPKYEFTKFKGVRVYNEIEEIELQMRLLVKDMQNRAKTGSKQRTLVVFDEFADAVSAAKSGVELDIREEVQVGMYKNGTPKYVLRTVGRYKSLEENLKMLLQKGRSLGFRIIAATQRASVQVITGDAKVNFPVQICFRVPKELDSKVVLDESGAEALAGMGDGLLRSPEYLDIVRFQGFYKK